MPHEATQGSKPLGWLWKRAATSMNNVDTNCVENITWHFLHPSLRHQISCPQSQSANLFSKGYNSLKWKIPKHKTSCIQESLSFFFPAFFKSSDFMAWLSFLAAIMAGSTLPTKGIPVLFTGTPRGHPTKTFSGFKSVWMMPHTRCLGWIGRSKGVQYLYVLPLCLIVSKKQRNIHRSYFIPLPSESSTLLICEQILLG